MLGEDEDEFSDLDHEREDFFREQRHVTRAR
jgi:hypothetical protein